jgi:hypothetical protein
MFLDVFPSSDRPIPMRLGRVSFRRTKGSNLRQTVAGHIGHSYVPDFSLSERAVQYPPKKYPELNFLSRRGAGLGLATPL